MVSDTPPDVSHPNFIRMPIVCSKESLMVDSLNCPKCGAPLTYNAEVENNAETITCPYCSGTVIIPASLRPAPSSFNFGQGTRPTVTTISSRPEDVYRPPTPARKSGNLIGGCITVLVFIGVVLGFSVLLASNSVKETVLKVIQEVNPAFTSTPMVQATDPASAVLTQVAPILEEATKAIGEIKNKALFTPTPDIEKTVAAEQEKTAAVEEQATLTALAALFDQQRAWPLVLQEKFSSANRNWNTGQDNNNLAVENLSITGNQYTWKMTSKKTMGSFSFPDMDTLSDLFVSVDLQVPASSENSSDQAGIIFRHSQAEKSFYFFGVNPGGTYSLREYDGSSWIDLIPLTVTDRLKPGQVNHLAVSIQDSQILLVINDTLIDNIQDTDLSEGTAGLGLYLAAPGEDVTIVFTNFSVRAPKK